MALLSPRSLLLIALLGCGAKSGLDAPTPEPPARDAGVDAGAPAPPEEVCIEAPVEGGPIRVPFVVPAALRRVDVFFLLDATGSMIDEIDNVREGLRDEVVPGVAAVIPDAWFGVGLVGEFPYAPHGSPGVLPYELRLPVTRDVLAVEGALERLPSWRNVDEPEAQVEGLYQVATGAGWEDLIPPVLGCPGGGAGGACFRETALPVVLLVTDAPFHDGPPGVAPESPYDFEPAPHGYGDAIRALRELGAFVIGLAATDLGVDSPRAHLDALARDTGTVDGAGRPLTVDIGRRGDRVDQGVVAAVSRLATDLPLDVVARFEDVRGDRVDAATLVASVRAASASPPDGVSELVGAEARGARPGTQLTYELVVDPTVVPPPDTTLRARGRLVFRAFDRSVLATVRVVVVVPGPDGDGC